MASGGIKSSICFTIRVARNLLTLFTFCFTWFNSVLVWCSINSVATVHKPQPNTVSTPFTHTVSKTWVREHQVYQLYTVTSNGDCCSCFRDSPYSYLIQLINSAYLFFRSTIFQICFIIITMNYIFRNWMLGSGLTINVVDCTIIVLYNYYIIF